jgi:hypothetical protein
MRMNRLDKAVVRAALHDARRLVASGRSAEEAAALACRGAWREYRTEVMVALVREAAPVAGIAAPFVEHC